jgi:hypothetical protein
VSDQDDGPPGPDLDESEPEEIILAEDLYERTNGGAPLAALLKEFEELLDPGRYNAEWWSKREQELADLAAKDAARTERDRMRHRAEMLVHTEGQQSGLRGRFPRWAVEGAQRAKLDTPAMNWSRKFLADGARAYAADTSRFLGERERDHDDSPEAEAKRVLLLGGGTGVGKTIAATWVALKSDDPMPGFIRASELERRGRYDKDLRGWIPERTSLVIDDLGAELLDGKGVFRSFLDEVVDQFYSSKRRLIITTNLEPRITEAYQASCTAEGREPEPQFRERYGDRVRSRVIQIGMWAQCGNSDLRVPTRPA